VVRAAAAARQYPLTMANATTGHQKAEVQSELVYKYASAEVSGTWGHARNQIYHFHLDPGGALGPEGIMTSPFRRSLPAVAAAFLASAVFLAWHRTPEAGAPVDGAARIWLPET